jgi:hypothetical protein
MKEYRLEVENRIKSLEGDLAATMSKWEMTQVFFKYIIGLFYLCIRSLLTLMHMGNDAGCIVFIIYMICIIRYMYYIVFIIYMILGNDSGHIVFIIDIIHTHTHTLYLLYI